MRKLRVALVGCGRISVCYKDAFHRLSDQMELVWAVDKDIEKAKEFLMCSSMKTSEIGYEVGYKDPHYFSYIFKKVQGCSPKEYRARGKE